MSKERRYDTRIPMPLDEAAFDVMNSLPGSEIFRKIDEDGTARYFIQEVGSFELKELPLKEEAPRFEASETQAPNEENNAA